LVDVIALDPALISETRHRIGVRLLPDARRVTRQTPGGPILCDLDLLSETDGPSRCAGWATPVTDETTALLAAMRARSVPEFQTTIGGFAFVPLIFLAADDAGTVGAITAARVPARARDQGFNLITSPAQSDHDWRRVWDGRDLPHSMNPSQGFIASANNRPAPAARHPCLG
jgi:penicillin amidase